MVNLLGGYFDLVNETLRVGKANGSRECAPDDKLRVPTIVPRIGRLVGTAQRAPLPTRSLSFTKSK